jgi:UPF0176 protein
MQSSVPPNPPEPQLHLSFYRFVPVEDPAREKRELLPFCRALGLSGTILVASEGVNGMLSGSQESLEELKREMRRRFGEPLPFKVGQSDPRQAFSRLLVKVKKELVPVGDPSLRPALRTAPRLSPSELKALLESGRQDLVLLDTRNAYEVEVGSFRGAEHLDLECSRDFAALAEAKLDTWRDKTVVTFCTGGIRCEKASAWLMERGLERVFQLDGGILRYFEETASADEVPHFDGSCFVFDWRLAVNGALEPVPRSADPLASFGRHKKRPRPAEEDISPEPHSAG